MKVIRTTETFLVGGLRSHVQAYLILSCFASQMLHFLQIEGLWQSCVEQAYQSCFYNSMRSHCVSMSRCGNSCTISNFLIIISVLKWSVIRDLWCYHSNCLGMSCTTATQNGKLNWWVLCVFWLLHCSALPHLSLWSFLFPETQWYWN